MREDDELDTLLATYRRHTSLSPETEDRILARVRDSAQRLPESAADETRGSAPVGWIAVGLALAAGLALLWMRPVTLQGEHEPVTPDAAARVVESASGEHEIESSGVRVPPLDRAAEASDATESSAESASASPSSEHGRTGARPRAREAVRAVVEDPPEASVQQALAEEAALLRRANALLSSGDASRAFDLLQDWESRFAPGHLREEHAALRAIALCALGRSIQGRGEAKAFERRHPSSAFVERVRSACADDREKNATGSTPAGQ